MFLKTMKKIIAAVLVIALILSIGFLLDSGNKYRVNSWCTSNGYTIKECERTWFDHGPFWFVGKNEGIYRAVLVKDGQERVSYFRVGLFVTQAWESE